MLLQLMHSRRWQSKPSRLESSSTPLTLLWVAKTHKKKETSSSFCSLRHWGLYLLQSAYLFPFFTVGLVPSFHTTLSHCRMETSALCVTSQPWLAAEAWSFKPPSILAFIQTLWVFCWSSASGVRGLRQDSAAMDPFVGLISPCSHQRNLWGFFGLF